MNFYTKNAINEECRTFLSDRGLNITTAEKMGIASKDGSIIFPYVFNGSIVRWKWRSLEDKKKMGFNTLVDQDKVNFKMPFWNQQIWPTSDYLIITEGELDAVAISQLGRCQVVSLPNGAGSVTTTFKNQYEYLQKFEIIYICFDMDEAGNKAAEEAKKLLPAKKYRRIMLPAKDANDWIKENPTVEKEDLDALMRNAEKICVDEIVYFRELPKTFFNARMVGVKTGWFDFDRILGGIRPGEVTVVSADTGAGKTTFCINLLCKLIAKENSGFWINSWEMDYEVVVRKIASMVLRKDFKVREFSTNERLEFETWMNDHNALINPKRSKADVASLHKQIELATRVYGVKYILLDHLDYISATSKSAQPHEKIAEAVVAIHDMAMEFGVHIFLIAHPKQVDDRGGNLHMGQLRGSAAIKQYADNILMLQNMAQSDLSQPDSRLKISIFKNRFFGTKGEVYLRYVPEMDGYETTKDLINGVSNEIRICQQAVEEEFL